MEVDIIQQQAVVAPPPIKSLIVGQLDVQAYQQTTLLEAQERVRLRAQAVAMVQAEVAQAEDGCQAAFEANVLDQQRQWRQRLQNRRNVLTRRQKSLDAAHNFLELVESGYLPIPRLESTNLNWLRDPMPPEALRTITRESEHGLFAEFRVVEPSASASGRILQRGRDPILVGLCDGEMFALAWWR